MYTILFIVIVITITVLYNVNSTKNATDKKAAEEKAKRVANFSLLFVIVGAILINVIDFGGEAEASEELTPVEIEQILSESGSGAASVAPAPSSPSVGYFSEEDIDKQFSPYDGSHRKLEEYVQERMKDPDSYEHVKSEYKAHPDYLEVVLTYRGKNSFNAVTTERVRAKCHLNTGEVLEIIN